MAVVLEDFVAEHFAFVRSPLVVALGDPSLAEDVTQEAFTQAWRRWGRAAVVLHYLTDHGAGSGEGTGLR